MDLLLQRAKQARAQPAVIQRYSIRALVAHVLQERTADGNAVLMIRSLISVSEVAMLDEVMHGALLFLRAGEIYYDGKFAATRTNCSMQVSNNNITIYACCRIGTWGDLKSVCFHYVSYTLAPPHVLYNSNSQSCGILRCFQPC